MKKTISIALVLSFILVLAPNHAFAASNKQVLLSKQVSFKEETTLDADNAPELMIRANSAYTQDFDFALVLKGAQWSEVYNDSGALVNTQDGVTYRKLSKNKLRFYLDTTKFDATKNDIHIPLLSTLKEEGEISVSIEQGTSPLSPNTYPYARLGGRSLSISTDFVKEMSHSMSLGDIVIKDEFMSPVDSDTVYTLKLNNDFKFNGKPQLLLTGKYEDCVTYHVDKVDASKAYLTISKRTDFGVGTIVLENLSIGPNNSSTYGPVKLTMVQNNNSAILTVAEYIMPSYYEMPIQITTFEGGKKPSASGTAAHSKTLQVRIDNEEYGTLDVDKGGNWNYIFPYKYSNLSAGKHSFSIGYYLTNGAWFNEVSTEFEIPKEKTTSTVIFKIGSPSYTYQGNEGYLDAPAFIDKNNKSMLPLRAVLNTLSIDNKDITWDEKEQIVTVKQGEKTFAFQIGSKTITINGVQKVIDTQAVIKDNRTFLPLRPLLNAFGIPDSTILWDADTQTIAFEV